MSRNVCSTYSATTSACTIYRSPAIKLHLFSSFISKNNRYRRKSNCFIGNTRIIMDTQLSIEMGKFGDTLYNCSFGPLRLPVLTWWSANCKLYQHLSIISMFFNCTTKQENAIRSHPVLQSKGVRQTINSIYFVTQCRVRFYCCWMRHSLFVAPGDRHGGNMRLLRDADSCTMLCSFGEYVKWK